MRMRRTMRNTCYATLLCSPQLQMNIVYPGVNVYPFMVLISHHNKIIIPFYGIHEIQVDNSN